MGVKYLTEISTWDPVILNLGSEKKNSKAKQLKVSCRTVARPARLPENISGQKSPGNSSAVSYNMLRLTLLFSSLNRSDVAHIDGRRVCLAEYNSDDGNRCGDSLFKDPSEWKCLKETPNPLSRNKRFSSHGSSVNPKKKSLLVFLTLFCTIIFF